MRSVGCKAGLTGVALLVAWGMIPAAFARIPASTDLVPLPPSYWDEFVSPDESVAQQTPATTTPPAAPAPATAPPAATPPATAAPAAQPATPPEAPAPGAAQQEPTPDDVLPDLSPEGQEGFSVGEIPTVEVVELTPDTARKAMDAYVLVHDKYKDAPLENYENLQDFVDQDAQGKAFEADIKSFGFGTANEWNTTITTVGFAYTNLLDDQTADLKQQIEEVKNDTEMAQDMRDRMVQALSAMIPSDNNRKVVDEMMKDPVYAEKLKMLETEEE